MNPSYIDNFEEYKMKKLNERANMIKNNKKFAEKIELILRDKADKSSKKIHKRI